MSTADGTWKWAQVSQLALTFVAQPLAECMGAKDVLVLKYLTGGTKIPNLYAGQ